MTITLVAVAQKAVPVPLVKQAHGDYIIETHDLVRAGQIARCAARTGATHGAVSVDGTIYRWATKTFFAEHNSYARQLQAGTKTALLEKVTLADVLHKTAGAISRDEQTTKDATPSKKPRRKPL